MRAAPLYSHISASDLQNAWAYAEAFPDEIEAAIKLNDYDGYI